MELFRRFAELPALYRWTSPAGLYWSVLSTGILHTSSASSITKNGDAADALGDGALLDKADPLDAMGRGHFVAGYVRKNG